MEVSSSSDTVTRTTAKWIKACAVDEVKEGKGKCIELEGGRAIALFLYKGKYFAMDDLCPHAGGPLSKGDIEDLNTHGPCVICPWHGWAFRIDDGKCVDGYEEWNQPKYEVKKEGSDLFIRVTTTETIPDPF